MCLQGSEARVLLSPGEAQEPGSCCREVELMLFCSLCCWIVVLTFHCKGTMSWPASSKPIILGGCGSLVRAALRPCSQHPTPLRVCMQGAQARFLLRPPEAQQPGSRSRDVELMVNCSLICWIVYLPVPSRGAVSCPAWIQTQNLAGCGCLGGAGLCPCSQDLVPI